MLLLYHYVQTDTVVVIISNYIDCFYTAFQNNSDEKQGTSLVGVQYYFGLLYKNNLCTYN